MIEIKPIDVPTKGVGKYFQTCSLKIDINTRSEAAPTFYWEVRTGIPYMIDEQETEVPGEVVLEGNIKMTQEEYALWSDDDNYVIDWALNKLGFEKI